MIRSRRLLLSLLLAAPVMAAGQNVATRDPLQHFFDANFGDLRAELAEAKKAGKKAILLYYEQEGCPACAYLKAHIFNRVDVQALYRRHFTTLAIDLFGSIAIRDFSGAEFTEKTFAEKARVRATPTFAFHDLTGREIVRVTGPIRDVAEFRLLAEFVAGGAYKLRSFAEHRQLHLGNPKG